MKKRLFTILLSLCIAVGLLAVPASAEEIASGTCGENLTWVLTDDGTLTISGEGEMEDFTGGWDENTGWYSSSAPWHPVKSEIRHIVIKSGVTSIGDYAFLDCKKMEDITIANTVRSIGDYAFWYCGDFGIDENEGFRHVTIPEGVTEIGEGAFLRCYNLESISLPNTLTMLGESAFCYTRLESVEIPGSLTVIREDAFFEVRTLERVKLHEGIKRIEDAAFAYCSPDVVVIPSTVEYIGNMAFSWCSPFDRFVVYSRDCIFAEDFYYPYSGTSCDTDFYGYAGSTTEAYTNGTIFDFYEIPSFTDTPGDSFYFAPVVWAVDNGITTGATETTFNPEGTCQRAQVVTFLWRAAGCPEPTTSVNPFTDVKESDFFYKAVLWAVENGITNGTSATTFSPYAECNRAAVVTFLWRAQGSPEPASTSCPFADVQAGLFYYEPVLWAVENGVTNGMSATTFGVNEICNRAQVVTFLHRTYVT